MGGPSRDYVTTMDPYRGGLNVTDEDIVRAVPFAEHGPEYLDWPTHLWMDHANGIPDYDLGRNAWHIKYLAELMVATGGWIGRPLELYECGQCIREGNHRYRAVQCLRDVRDIIIEPVLNPERFPGCNNYCQRVPIV